jgi:hypothetical protein
MGQWIDFISLFHFVFRLMKLLYWKIISECMVVVSSLHHTPSSRNYNGKLAMFFALPGGEHT